jgi:menaquinone-dependent protoporphyrinogen oxidase
MPLRVLVCYGSRFGSTFEIAEEIASTIKKQGAQVDIINLRREPLHDILPYDMIVVGSGIENEGWTDETLSFIRNNIIVLSRKRIALFAVCSYDPGQDNCDIAKAEYLERVADMYPTITPFAMELFGGVVDFTRYNMALRDIMKQIVERRHVPEGEIQDYIDFHDWGRVRKWAEALVQ